MNLFFFCLFPLFPFSSFSSHPWNGTERCDDRRVRRTINLPSYVINYADIFFFLSRLRYLNERPAYMESRDSRLFSSKVASLAKKTKNIKRTRIERAECPLVRRSVSFVSFVNVSRVYDTQFGLPPTVRYIWIPRLFLRVLIFPFVFAIYDLKQ